MGFDTEQSVVAELKLFTENDADIYRQTTVPILGNLRTKQVRGIYDRELAVQGLMYLAERGARKYAREHGGGEAEWHTMFPANIRRQAAREWRDEFEVEAALGNYDSPAFVPKKYLSGKCIVPECQNYGLKPHGACQRHVNEAKQGGVPTQRSKIYRLGVEAGRTYPDMPGASRRELHKIMISAKKNRPSAGIRRDLGGSLEAVRAHFNMPENVSDQAIQRALDEFDRGFNDGAQAVFDAMEGN